MMKQKTFTLFYSALTTILITTVSALAIIIVTSVPMPIGSDVYFHLDLAKVYATGNFAQAWSLMFKVISFFYPFFYQAVILFPVAISPDPYLGLRILEIIFMPLTFTATMYLVWKHASQKAAFFTGAALLASWSFIDGTLQARPESLDLLLFPIITYAVLEAKKKTAGAASSILIWSHGLASISSVFGIFIYKLRDKTWRKTLIILTLIASPILVLTAIYYQGAVATWVTGQTITSNPQQYMFWNNPFPWIIYYAGLSLLGIPFLFRKGKTQLETIMTYAFVGNTAMVFLWADRWLHYSVIPWAILFGVGISRWHGKKLYGILAFTTVVLAFYLSIFLLTSFAHLWWQPGN
jgi:hypothetical protein